MPRPRTPAAEMAATTEVRGDDPSTQHRAADLPKPRQSRKLSPTSPGLRLRTNRARLHRNAVNLPAIGCSWRCLTSPASTS